MSKQIINNVADSIKSKLSFDDYKPNMQSNLIEELTKFVEKQHSTDAYNAIVKSEHNAIVKSEHNAIIKVKKVKRTFYILESIADELDDFYARKLSEKKKVDKSDIVAQALKNLLADKNCIVEEF